MEFLNPAETLRAAGVHEGMQVADFGSGSGFFTRAAARLVGEGGAVWAVDINRELLARTKSLAVAEGLQNVEIMHGNLEEADGSNLPENHFDLVLVSNLLFGLEEKTACVAEVHRVLKRGGKALVIDWSGSHGGLGPHADHVITEQEGRKLFEEQGFHPMGAVPAGAYHWGFIVRRKA